MFTALVAVQCSHDEFVFRAVHKKAKLLVLDLTRAVLFKRPTVSTCVRSFAGYNLSQDSEGHASDIQSTAEADSASNDAGFYVYQRLYSGS